MHPASSAGQSIAQLIGEVSLIEAPIWNAIESRNSKHVSARAIVLRTRGCRRRDGRIENSFYEEVFLRIHTHDKRPPPLQSTATVPTRQAILLTHSWLCSSTWLACHSPHPNKHSTGTAVALSPPRIANTVTYPNRLRHISRIDAYLPGSTAERRIGTSCTKELCGSQGSHELENFKLGTLQMLQWVRSRLSPYLPLS